MEAKKTTKQAISTSMTPAKRKWLQVLHIAKKQCGLDDEAYRALLQGSCGVSSAKDITEWRQYNECLRAFKRLGFKEQTKSGKPSIKDTTPQEGRNPKWISARQEYYIRGLWELASRNKDEASLNKLVKRLSGTDNIAWISRSRASAVIAALRDIAGKAGFDPDKPPPDGERGERNGKD
jgi:hypothetical protein